MGHTVVIVEDDVALRRMLALALERAGFRVIQTGRVHQTISILDSESVDLLLLDLGLGYECGLDILKAVRSSTKNKKMPVVILTGDCGRDTVVEAGKIGIHSYLLKSNFSLKELIVRVKVAIGGSTEGVAAHNSEISTECKPASPSQGDKSKASSSSPANLTANIQSDKSTDVSKLSETDQALTTDEALLRLKDLKPFMTRDQIIDRVISDSDLKAIGPVAQRVISLSADSSTTTEQLARALKQDQALALRILRLANLPILSEGESIDSVNKAVDRIGRSQIRAIVLSRMMIDQFSRNGKIGRVNTEWFWEHSLFTGVIASRISKARGAKLETADDLFAAGLLHDIGRVLYASKLSDEYTIVIDQAEELDLPLETVESKLLLINHAEMTEKLLQSWKFPPEVTNPISHHHLSLDDTKQTAPKILPEVCTLALADRLSHALALGSSGNNVLYPIEEFIQELGLNSELIESICTEVPDAAMDLRLSLALSSGSVIAWPLDLMREQVSESVSPLIISLNSARDPVGILFKRIFEMRELSTPTVAVLRVCNPHDCEAIEAALTKEEESRKLPPLPILVVGDSKSCLFPPTMLRDRSVQQVILPMKISRLIRELNEASAPAASGRRAA